MQPIRRPEAVRELEALQQQERTSAGEPLITPEDHLRLLRDDIQGALISRQLEAGGLSAAIEAAGDNEVRTDQIVAERLREWHVADPSQWSRHESPAVRWALADICTRIEAVFLRHGWQLPELPAVGTLTTGQVSAVTQTTDAGAPLVLIDNGFFRFSGALSQLAVFASYDLQAFGEFSEATLQLLCDLVATQTVLNTCLYLYPRKTPPAVEAEVEALQDAICLFVLGHEYAHISAGDLDAHPFKHDQALDDPRSSEFAADKIGFVVSSEGIREGADEASGVFGAFLYLAGLDLLTRAAAAYKGQPATYRSDPSSPDYPTPYERTVELLNWLDDSRYADQFDDQIRTASACYNIILSVWDQIFPVFWAVRDELSAYDPSLHGQSLFPEADTFGVMHRLWQHVLSHLRRT